MFAKLFAKIGAWIARIDWYRVKRTFIQVFGPTLIAFVIDFGFDGVVDVRSYIFGNEGAIIIGALALATLMNIPKKSTVVDFDDYEDDLLP